MALMACPLADAHVSLTIIDLHVTLLTVVLGVLGVLDGFKREGYF